MLAIWVKIISALSGDIAFFVALFIVIFLCAMYFGKNRMASLILAFYPATMLYKSFPYLNKLIFLSGDREIVINKIVIFLVLFGFVNFIVRKYIDLFGESGGIFKKVGLSVAILIVILLFSYNVISLNVFHVFSSSIDTLFTNTNLIFWENLAPLVILMFV